MFRFLGPRSLVEYNIACRDDIYDHFTEYVRSAQIHLLLDKCEVYFARPALGWHVINLSVCLFVQQSTVFLGVGGGSGCEKEFVNCFLTAS